VLGLAVPICALAAVAASGSLAPSARLVSSGELGSRTLSPDGKALFAVVKGRGAWELAAWDLKNGSKTALASGPGDAGFFASPDGSLLVLVSGTCRQEPFDLDLATWDMPRKLRSPLLKLSGLHWGSFSFGFSSDSGVLTVADGSTTTLHLWRREAAGKWNALAPVHWGAGPSRPALTFLAVAPGGEQVFLISRGLWAGNDVPWAVEKWDVASGTRLPFRVEVPDTTFPLFRMSTTRDGGTLCLQTIEGPTGIDAATGKRKYALTSRVAAVSVSRDGRVGAAIDGLLFREPEARATDTITFWNVSDGTGQRRLSVPGRAGASAGAFSADARYFVCAGGPESRRAYLIDVAAAKIRSSWAADATLEDFFLLSTGEIAAVGTERDAIVIYKITPP